MASKSKKLPAFQFYPGDWRKDPGVQSLCHHDRSVWFEMLCFMHESSERGRLLLNGKQMPLAALAKLVGLGEQELQITIDTLLERGVASQDSRGLFNRRMLKDEKLRKTRAKCGKLGGNPDLVKQNSTTPLKQKPTPSSSSSSSSSISNSPSSPPAGNRDVADPVVSVLRWAGVGGGEKELREKGGSAFDVIHLFEQLPENARSPGGLIVHKLRNGFKPLQKFSVDQVKRWIDRGYISAVAEQPVVGRTGFSSTMILLDADGEIPVEVPAENLVPENIKLKLPLPARSQRA